MSITTPQGRWYDIDGKKLPSVTTILGMLQKPALVSWAAKMTAESFEEQMMAYYHPEEASFIVPDTALPAMLDTAKKAHRVKSSTAMAHGTRVHEAIAFWIDSQSFASFNEVADYIKVNYPCTAEELDLAMAGFNAFMLWADSVNLNIHASETVVTDNDFYAGRYDLFATVNGKAVLIDIKTSTGIYDEYWLQCAAYASAGFEELPDALGILRIDKVTGDIEYVEKLDYHHEIEAFNMLAIAYDHLQKCKSKKEKK